MTKKRRKADWATRLLAAFLILLGVSFLLIGAAILAAVTSESGYEFLSSLPF